MWGLILLVLLVVEWSEGRLGEFDLVVLEYGSRNYRNKDFGSSIF